MTEHNSQHIYTTEADASEFGNHVRQGGWRLGLLVARNVEKAEHGGARRGSSFNRNLNDKVNAKEFAKLSGVGHTKVLRYLAAWNRAAEQGHVPASADLTPGEDIDLDVDALPAWTQFYEETNRSSDKKPDPIKPSVEEVTEAIRENPEYAEAVSEYIEPTSEQVTRAMRSNPEVEQAARDAAWDITLEKAREKKGKSEKPRSPEDCPAERTLGDERADLGRLMLSMRKARRALDDALLAAHGIESFRDDPSSITADIRQKCDEIESALTSGGFDAQLSALLSEEGDK